jgi:hypothetical protein
MDTGCGTTGRKFALACRKSSNDIGDADEFDRNGDKRWTAGPPQEDAVFKIQKIVMYYNPGS